MNVKLTWEEWVEQFKPIVNPLRKDRGDNSKYEFETYGEELDLLFQLGKDKSHCIWTLICEGSSFCIIEGFNLVNRMVYYLTKKSYDYRNTYEVDNDMVEEENDYTN